MDTQKIVKALAGDASYTFVFDVTTGVIEKDIISSDGTNYTQLAGLSSPCSFNDLVDIYFIKEKKCRILSDDKKQSLSREFLIDSYFSGKIRLEINIFYKITNAYYRILYFLYEDNDSGHVFAFVVCRLINEVENEVFTTNGNKKSKLQEEKETFYKNMMDIQSCGVLAYTFPGYQIVNANAETLRMFGYKSIDDMQSKLYDIIAAVHYTSSDTLEKLKNLRKEDGTVDHEFILNKGEENECYVIAKTKIIYSPNGKRIIYSTYVDASEMHALKTVLEKAEAGNKAKSAFLFNMSHDLRTPMNAILGYAELMQSHWEDKQVAEEYLRKLMDSSKFLLFLLNNAIELASLENGNETVKESLWNANRFNDMLDSIIENSIHEKNIHFSRTINIEHNDVMCDAMKLRIIFLNLLSNAIKYTPSGGSISMNLEELPSDKEGYVVFKTVITDNGIGISPEFMPHIFENFSRERNTSLSGIHGTGLGMPVVKKLIDLMGGSISIESSLGKGTTVTVNLLHKIANRDELIQFTEESAIDSKLIDGKRILLVEDNELNAEIALVILSDAGFTCEHVMDGAAAFSAIVDHPLGYYDLVLMDIQMPIMDGYQTTQKIRNLKNEKSKIPIIAMTANALEEDRRAALAAGMNDHIAKPIDITKLMNTLFRILT
ncbi:MAG: ATP-binding protein [Suilimivivens sp.]